MAYSAEDYRKLWAARTTVELRQQSLMLNLLGGGGEWTDPWVAGAQTVYIPRPDWEYDATDSEGVHASPRARGGDWAAALTGDQSVMAFTRSGGYATTNSVLWEDAIELPWPAVERTRSRQRYIMRKSIDEQIWALLTGGLSAQFQAYGSNSANIGRTSKNASNAGARELIFTILQDYSLKLEEANVDGSGDNVGGKWAIMPPAIFRILTQYMLAEKYSWDQLTRDLLVNNSVLVRVGYKGRLFDIDIFSWNGVPLPGSTAGANTFALRSRNWPVLCGVSAGAAAALRPPLVQYWTPETNQVSDNPEHLLRQAGDFGYLTLEPSLFTLAGIDGGPDS